MKKVIDISYHNGNIDFKKVKYTGIENVIIRCGYGDNYVSQDDKKFDEYMKAAIEQNMFIALYIYSYAETSTQAISEAEHIIRQHEKYKDYRRLSKVLWYDIEEQKYIKSAKTVFTSFKTYVERKGFIAGLYTGHSYFYNSDLHEACADVNIPLWIARYGINNGEIPNGYEPKMYCDLWQYTSNAIINGITTRTDISKIMNENPLLFPQSIPTYDINAETAIKILVDNGIISSPDYWYSAVKVVKFLDILLINTAKKLKAVSLK